MKKLRAILIFILIVLIVVVVPYLTYLIIHNIDNEHMKQENTISNTNNSDIKKPISEENTNNEDNNAENNDNQKENESYIGEEETSEQQININEQTIQSKAIESVKNVWWGDQSAIFTIDNSAKLESNQVMVKVSHEGATWWYVVNTDTWEVNEY